MNTDQASPNGVYFGGEFPPNPNWTPPIEAISAYPPELIKMSKPKNPPRPPGPNTQICSVCSGNGEVPGQIFVNGKVKKGMVPCKACKGTGKNK